MSKPSLLLSRHGASSRADYIASRLQTEWDIIASSWRDDRAGFDEAAMRVDAIVEHATPEERKRLIARHGGGFWTLGLICALLNLLPPAWIVLPVFSALVCAHYGLDALQRARQLPTRARGLMPPSPTESSA